MAEKVERLDHSWPDPDTDPLFTYTDDEGVERTCTLDAALERAAGLAFHASGELGDERERFLHRWKVV